MTPKTDSVELRQLAAPAADPPRLPHTQSVLVSDAAGQLQTETSTTVDGGVSRGGGPKRVSVSSLVLSRCLSVLAFAYKTLLFGLPALYADVHDFKSPSAVCTTGASDLAVDDLPKAERQMHHKLKAFLRRRRKEWALELTLCSGSVIATSLGIMQNTNIAEHAVTKSFLVAATLITLLGAIVCLQYSLRVVLIKQRVGGLSLWLENIERYPDSPFFGLDTILAMPAAWTLWSVLITFLALILSQALKPGLNPDSTPVSIDRLPMASSLILFAMFILAVVHIYLNLSCLWSLDTIPEVQAETTAHVSHTPVCVGTPNLQVSSASPVAAGSGQAAGHPAEPLAPAAVVETGNSTIQALSK